MEPAVLPQKQKKKSATEGKNYENIVRERFLKAGFTIAETAGSCNRPDLRIPTATGAVCIELKNKNAHEGGQKAIKPVDNKCIVNDAVLWEGKIPSFLTGNASLETWNNEKAQFKGVYFEVDGGSVGEYYRLKGSSYIQIQGKGLYHTGIDPLSLGVPRFEAATKLRIRCKQFRKSTVPSSIMSSLCFSRKSVRPSEIDIDKMSDADLERMFQKVL